jgi:poly-gamma-glutamate synthesis protein (capsule biosynthesis protein)
VFHFRTDAKNIDVLRSAGISGVSLANNHILDYEEDALLDCLRILDENGILHSGAGADLAGAQKPFIAEVSGIRIGFLAFTDNEPDWEAGCNKPGTFYVPIDLNDQRACHLMELVRSLGQETDICVVSAHWGPNWGYRPPKEHIGFAHALVDAGADVIFGHSPHVFRGVEIYKGRPILYSTGDFIDDYAVDEIERNDRSCIFVVEFAGDRLDHVILYPTVIDNFQAKLALQAEADEILDRLIGLCAGLGTHTLRADGHIEIPA